MLFFVSARVMRAFIKLLIRKYSKTPQKALQNSFIKFKRAINLLIVTKYIFQTARQTRKLLHVYISE